MERRKVNWEKWRVEVRQAFGFARTVIVMPTVASLQGILKHVQQDSVSLKHNLGEIWAEANEVSRRR